MSDQMADRFKNFIPDVQSKQFTQSDLDSAIRQARAAVLEAIRNFLRVKYGMSETAGEIRYAIETEFERSADHDLLAERDKRVADAARLEEAEWWAQYVNQNWPPGIRRLAYLRGEETTRVDESLTSHDFKMDSNDE